MQNDNSTKNPVFAIDSLIGLTQQSTKLWVSQFSFALGNESCVS